MVYSVFSIWSKHLQPQVIMIGIILYSLPASEFAAAEYGSYYLVTFLGIHGLIIHIQY